MPSLKSLIAALAALTPLATAQIAGQCPPGPITSDSNPLSNRKNLITGTTNGTTIVLPIALTAARKIIPSEYKILQKQYKQWLPTLGANQYPMILQMDLYHDIYEKGVKSGEKGDFLRAALTFPFVDRLGDGHSAFAYERDAIVSTSNTAAQNNYGLHGIDVLPGFFSACNGYEYDNGTESLPPAERRIDQAAWRDDTTDLSNPDLAYRMTPVDQMPYSNDFFLNVTSQPLFGAGSGCENFVHRLDTRVSKGANAPVAIKGDAAAMQAVFPIRTKTMWADVYGLKVDSAFSGRRNVGCPSLKGFSVVNAP